MKLLAFGASNSQHSINQALATYAAHLVSGAQVETLNLNDYELPIYSPEREKELGKPALAQAFLDEIAASDALIISFAEHNGSYTAAYKNLFDWCSRINGKVYQNKPMVLLSTSPGARGAANILASAKASMPFFGGEVKATFSLPNFYDNFDLATQTLKNETLKQQLEAELHKLNT